MLQFIRIFTLILIVLTAIYVLVIQPRQAQQESSSTTAQQQVAIGGAFTLHDPAGNVVTNDSLKGKPRLVYFGYTYCPDICPTALIAMQSAAKNIAAASLQQVFITVDPERDTPERLAEYAANFPTLIALTGSMEEIKEATRAYKIYFQKASTSAGDENYLVDHSSFIYLMDAEGKYLAHYPHDISAKKLEAAVRAALENTQN